MAAALAGTMRYCINKAVSLYHIVLLLVACVNFLPTICSSMLLGDSFVNLLTTRLKKMLNYVVELIYVHFSTTGMSII